MDIYSVIKTVLWRLDPERAHHLALWALSHNLVPAAAEPDDPRLSVAVLGRRFTNPIGLAAGFDKDARVWRQARHLGFGLVEVGSVTPRPQSGNPQPRLFRLEKDRAVINRMGFNNAGVEAMAAQLASRSRDGDLVLRINLGTHKQSADAAPDYERGVRRLGSVPNYIVINVSSPNTPGLRALQAKATPVALIARTHDALTEACGSYPSALLLKLAPD